MIFDEKKFKEELLNNPKIENNYAKIIDKIHKENIEMLEPEYSLFDKFKDILSSKKVKIGVLSTAGILIVVGATLGGLLPNLGGPTPTVKVPPTFLGISLKKASEITSEAFNFNYKDLAENIEIEKNEKIVLDLSFNNPDSLEISSFKISRNEEEATEYTAEDYLEGSNYSHIYVDAGIMDTDEVTFKVSDLLYLDENGVTNDVLIEGETSLDLKVPVIDPIPDTDPEPDPNPEEPEEPEEEYHEAVLTKINSEINIDSAKYDFNLVDVDSTLSNAKAYLYEGSNEIGNQDITLSENFSVSFNGLTENKEYRIQIQADKVLKDGSTNRNALLFSESFTTISYFDSFDIEESYTSANLVFTNLRDDVSIDKVDVYSENSIVSTLENITGDEVSIPDLLSNHSYELRATLSINNEHPLEIRRVFNTLTYDVPTFEIGSVVPGVDRVDFTYRINDPQDLGDVTNVELYKGEEFIKNTTGSFFGSLEGGTSYEIRVTYEYDLLDGTGPKIITDSETFTTQTFSLSIRAISTSASSSGNRVIVGASYNVSIAINNATRVEVKTFVINGESYNAVLTNQFEKNEYRIDMTAPSEPSVVTFEITGCTYELNGTTHDYTFEEPGKYQLEFFYMG